MSKKIVVLTGAGISAESGLATFRGADGLWEGHRIEDVASPEGWARNPELVLDFYNQRRSAARKAQPNAGHHALVAMEKGYEVVIVTQNVDDLHERAGSSRVIHLHGQLFQSRSTRHEELVYPMTSDRIEMGELCEKGHQLRPNIVWFGEAVPLMERAIEEAATADIFMVVGTSLQVYPAAGLLQFAPQHCPIIVIDLHQPPLAGRRNVRFVAEPASTGVPRVATELLSEY
ncbi:NAD-dependent protein deacylase [Hymenobacter qilianensis]|uniref:NAD-dependent protein deacylase n=2 Tax=Hymenobacter qilianensis TaxID=1385715 RepID=A0ACB5PR37_9BACT|nr:NAD-dependent deacylase [Hymenobacter qilianensis]QNP52047.1 NAD-dependent deacylase [Hymenobacter qilianensis]GGF64077.1 NAD-dependent protein deacylase [Hymenobacter qilianensis]